MTASSLPTNSGLKNPLSEPALLIIQAAQALFASNGYDGTSISAIAESAGVSKANVFHHFSSKRELYFKVLDYACNEFNEILEKQFEKKAPLEEQVKEFAGDHINSLVQREQTTRLILREMIEGNSESAANMAEHVAGERFSRMVELIRGWQSNGTVRPDVDPAMVVLMLVGADFFFFLAQPVLKHLSDVSFSDDPQRYARGIADLLVNGIASGSPDPAGESK